MDTRGRAPTRKLKKLLQPAIRFDIRDVWDGPPMTTQQREVQLTPEQTKAMAQLKRDLQIVTKAGHPITAANEAAARLKFIQISLGAVYDHDHKAHFLDAAPRYAELERIIDEAPGKLLVFAPLTSVVKRIKSVIGAKHKAEIVNGETPQRERSDIFERFQSAQSDLRLLIADPGTMAHGLNLWMASNSRLVWNYGQNRTLPPSQQASASARTATSGNGRPDRQQQAGTRDLPAPGIEREPARAPATDGTGRKDMSEQWILVWHDEQTAYRAVGPFKDKETAETYALTHDGWYATTMVVMEPPDADCTDAQLIEKYQELKALVAQEGEAFDARMKPYKDGMATIENALLARLNERGAENTKTEAGTAYKLFDAHQRQGRGARRVPQVLH